MLTAAILFLVFASYGQQVRNEKGKSEITGKVMDSSSHLPLEYATITLFAAGKNKPLNGTTSDSAGHFILTNISPGSFNVTVEFIGYKIFNLTNIIVTEK